MSVTLGGRGAQRVEDKTTNRHNYLVMWVDAGAVILVKSTSFPPKSKIISH